MPTPDQPFHRRKADRFHPVTFAIGLIFLGGGIAGARWSLLHTPMSPTLVTIFILIAVFGAAMLDPKPVYRALGALGRNLAPFIPWAKLKARMSGQQKAIPDEDA